jgi:hypothetical protein
VSRVMRVGVMMMRMAKHGRALGGAVGLDRLETGAHEGHYPPLSRRVKCARAICDRQCHLSHGGSGRSLDCRNSGLNSLEE